MDRYNIERTGKMLVIQDQARQVSRDKAVIYQGIMIPVSNLQTIIVSMALYIYNHIQPVSRLLSTVDQEYTILNRTKDLYEKLAIHDIIKIIRLWPTG